ncbi:activating signal cointegrator 1 complex subunit 1-like [Bradysia coprophila]|uniref:activating signal cointegrator 1 complex subunit 1-like n=1 Tax=Bradysia coprophila TaxID=38358 RepID=UPI00187DA70E|nr:activating signal cointegrator 1 complex subunit 1-like [Bradysia coprophila]
METSSKDEKSSRRDELVHRGGRFELTIDIDPKFYGRIIGAQGNTKRKIEQEFNTQILVPARGSLTTAVIVKGDTEDDVISTVQRLKQFTKSDSRFGGVNRRRPNIPRQKFTHFLSISFATDEIKRNFAVFSDEIRSNPKTRHLHESMIQRPEKLHITISMLVLDHGDKDETFALDCLDKCKATIIDPILQDQPLVLTAAGVEIFSDCEPSAVNVVFAKVVSAPLQEIANKMARFFESCGLVKQERESIALHLTLLNTYLYQGEEDGKEEDIQRCQAIKRQTFDATSILERHKDCHFGTVRVEQIHLCRLGTVTADGYYESAGFLQIE